MQPIEKAWKVYLLVLFIFWSSLITATVGTLLWERLALRGG